MSVFTPNRSLMEPPARAAPRHCHCGCATCTRRLPCTCLAASMSRHSTRCRSMHRPVASSESQGQAQWQVKSVEVHIPHVSRRLRFGHVEPHERVGDRSGAGDRR